MAFDQRKSRHRSVPEASQPGTGPAAADRKGLGTLFVERAAVASLICLAGIYLVGAVDIAGQARQLGIDFPMMFSYFSIDEILTRGISRVLNPVAIALFAAVVGLLFVAGEGSDRGSLSVARSRRTALRVGALILSVLFLAFVLVVDASAEVVISAVVLAALVGVRLLAPIAGAEVGPRGLVALGAIVIGGWFLATSWISPSLGPFVMFVDRGEPKPFVTAGLVINHGDGNWFVWEPAISGVTAIPDRQVLAAASYPASVRDNYITVASSDFPPGQWRLTTPIPGVPKNVTGREPNEPDQQAPRLRGLRITTSVSDDLDGVRFIRILLGLRDRLARDCLGMLANFTPEPKRAQGSRRHECLNVAKTLVRSPIGRG